MKAFHNDPALKEQILTRLQAHYDAKEIEKGLCYWEKDKKGGPLYCTVHSEEYKDYETQLGIPEILARLENYIFEELPDNTAKEWPLSFIRAIPVGADLSKVWAELTVFLLINSQYGILQYAQTKEQKEIIRNVAGLYLAKREVPETERENIYQEAKRIYELASERYNLVYRENFNAFNVCRAAYDAAIYYTSCLSDNPNYNAAMLFIRTVCSASYVAHYDTMDHFAVNIRNEYYKIYSFLANKLIELLLTGHLIYMRDLLKKNRLRL